MHVLNWVKVYFRRFTTPRNGRTILFQGNIMKLFDGITVQVVEAITLSFTNQLRYKLL